MSAKVMDETTNPTETAVNSARHRYFYFFVDALCALCVGLPIALFKYVGEPYHRGFYCDDTSISKPFKHSTVPSDIAVVVGVTIDILPVVINEVVKHRHKKSASSDYTEFPLVVGPFKVPRFVIHILEILWIMFFGGLVNVLITDVGKYTLGRLRPHFLTVCQPNMTLFNCSDGFIMKDVCTGDVALIREARLSFPSGHSSYAAYAMVFAILYIESDVHIPGSKFLKFVIQLILVLMGLLCGMSRISDYKHHWSDVLVGFIIGTIVAYFTHLQMLGFRRPKQKQSSNLPSESCPIYLSGV